MSPVLRFGDRALRFVLSPSTDRGALFAELRALPHVEDVVLTEALGAVVLDEPASTPDVLDALARILDRGPAAAPDPSMTVAPTSDDARPRQPRLHRVPTIYDGADLDELAGRLALTRSQLIALHADREYTVAMLGFLPGFGYLRGLDPRLAAVTRRSSPRPRVHANAVAMAAGYTGIYPLPSPGGWHLLGRAVDFVPFDLDNGATLAIDDRVRFVPVEASSFDVQESGTTANAARDAFLPVAWSNSEGRLEVVRAVGPAIVVDAGRPGRLHQGIPAGGPLCAAALARANAAVGNDPGACAIEVYGVLDVVARGSALTLADDDGNPVTLRPDERYALAPRGTARVRYLAVANGLDVPRVLGGRGTLLVAGFGGHEGRPLKRGDVLGVSASASEAKPLARETRPSDVAVDARSASTEALTVPVQIGPDELPSELVEALTTTTFRISAASDRTGTRLDVDTAGDSPFGRLVEHRAALQRPSGPMVRGAIELTPTGPIVLGPDHPTTGGYPVIATVRERALDVLFMRPCGARIQFVVRA